MIWQIIAVAAIMALGVAPAAEAGFWGDLKQSFGTAVDNAGHDGADAVDAVFKGAGDAADAVVEGAESAADFVTGDSANADSQPVDNTADPVADGSKQLTKQAKK
jgi:hypothetical protein